MKAIQIQQTGGPEVLTLHSVAMPQPGPTDVRVKVQAAGINYIDVYHRTGLYPLALPAVIGLESAGVVEAVGTEVTLFKPGDRVACGSHIGAYAEYTIIPQDKLVAVPDAVSSNQAAAVMLQGMTAHYLAFSTYPLKAGQTALIHAAAGGVGLLLVQLAKKIGATVIGTVSTEEKAQLARKAGADHIIFYTREDFAVETRRLTGGKGVNVVYDSVGQATFEKSLNVLAMRGYLVLFGQSSGAVPPFELQMLNAKGSLFITRPSLFHYIATRDDLLWRAGDLLGWIADGSLDIRIDRILPLAEAAEGHRLLTGRQTAGKVLLAP